MNRSTSQNLNSPFADQRKRGFELLRFTNFVEEEFLQYYTQSVVQRSRLLPIFALAATLMSLGVMLAREDSHPITLIFEIAVMLPVLSATLWASLHPRFHRVYQLLLATSALLIGMWLNSTVIRASIAGSPNDFSALIAWIFVVWLLLGLPFRHAAIVAVAISGAYIASIFQVSVVPDEPLFNTVLLIVVNGLGGYCGYQFEYAVRRSFLESKVLSQLAERDGLTGLYNRRSYDEYAERIWRQSRREKAQVTLILVDIDHFKDFNDHYGHQAGDDALKEVADVIGYYAQRPLDFAARYGGEEFALVLYGPAHDYGRELPDQIREAVRDLKISHELSETNQYLTISVGVAMVLPGSERSLAGAIQMADEALYQAKEEGRNRVVVRESDSHIQTGRFRASRAAAG